MTATLQPVNRVNGTEQSVPTTKPAPKKRASTKRRTSPRKSAAKKRLESFRLVVTIALGVAIPALSLALSHIAGTLGRHDHTALAAFVAACGVSVLAVSLSHLAEAVEDITGAQKWQAWLLAVTLDLTIVACELVEVYAADVGLVVWCRVLMLVVAGFSMALNCYAFLSTKR